MFQPNAVIAGRYQVVRLVGQGGMSNLYLAYDRKYSNATVVVKEMTASYSDPKEQKMAVDLFHREAKLLASLNHRHIPKVYDYFQFAGKYYLSMEYIDGEDLAVRLEDTKGPLPEDQVLKWGEQIAQVLFYLHKHEPPIVFRDVKPSNIMISSKGIKLIDFGIARHFDQAKKGDTMRIGSPGYAPPEQYAAQTDPRSDIYALGVTLHHALTGRDPTATNTPFLVPPARDLNPALSEGTAAMLARATQLDPADRYQSALEMRKDIKQILNRGQQSTRVVGAPPAPTADANKGATPTSATANSAAPAQAANATPTGTGNPTPTAAAGTPAAQSGSSSGSLPPTANPAAASGSGQLAPTPATPPSPKKKRPSFASLLLVAAVFILSAGAAALFSMGEADRNALLTKAKQYFHGAISDISRGQNPESRLKDYLLQGSPEALLQVFQSPDFKELSEEKKELYRLNLLALGSEQGEVKILHVLVPEAYDGSELWKVATKVVGTVNSTGGLGRELLVILPETYLPGQLGRTLSKLDSKKETKGRENQSFLVVNGSEETVPEEFKSRIFRLSAAHTDGPNFLASEPDIERAFQLEATLAESPLVWGISGPIPTQATEPETKPERPLTIDALDGLLSQSESLGAELLLWADDAKELTKVDKKGKVLLIATTASQLPEINGAQEGRALVLSSPFESTKPADAIRLRPATGALTIEDARAFDALALASLPPNRAYYGLTVQREEQGTFNDKTPTSYRWNGKTWLPTPGETGKNE